MSDTVDVAIVGAGPAGSSTALHLLQAAPGTKIMMIERARLPRDKPCGGAISAWGLGLLDALDASPGALGVDSVPIRAIRVRRGDACGEHRVAKGAPPLGAVVWRASFDAALAREAARRGAALIEGCRLAHLAFERGTHVLTTRSEDGRIDTIRARIVVGADGSGSAVRRLAGFVERGRHARLLVTETDAANADDLTRDEGGVIEFDLGVTSEGIDGYVWHFATTVEGARKVSRGVYDWRGRRTGSAAALRAKLQDVLGERGVEIQSIEASRAFKPFAERVFVRSDGPRRSSHDGSEVATREGVLLVGEAAGFVDPVTGEGIAQAIASGKTAAHEIGFGLRSGVDPRRYARALSAERWHRHLCQTDALCGLAYGRFAAAFGSAFASTPTALDAGADWYAGRPLGALRKARVAAELARALFTGGIRRASG